MLKNLILEVKNLSVFENKQSIIKNISFDLKRNSCLGILGESGSGKSITCKAIAGLLNDNLQVNGEIIFNNENLNNVKKKRRNELRGKDICMIIQNPMTAFNPLFTIENQVLETLITHKKMKKIEAVTLILDSFEKMNLKEGEKILKKYPNELSGGMLQRIMIALSICLNPSLIIADEPTTAIDVVNQVEIIKEFKKIRKVLDTTLIFISHDLSILNQIADEFIVMKNGEIIEKGVPSDIINNPINIGTKELIDTRLKLINKFKELVEV